MNKMVLSTLLFLSFFLFNVKSQETTSLHITNQSHPNLLAALVTLSIILFLAFLVLAYVNFCKKSVSAAADDHHLVDQEQDHGSRNSGIDKTVIESLPSFRFSSLKGSKQGLECVVCLSKFEDTEILRLLPNCEHAFHKACIDQWLQCHSSCPLCRHRFVSADFTSFIGSTNSLRYPHISTTLMEDQNLELYVRRDKNLDKSSSFHKLVHGRNHDEDYYYYHQENMHKFKLRIIVSDIVNRSRWSDVNSSDFLFLNSEMLSVSSSWRPSQFQAELSLKEQLVKIKEDMERKRVFESKVGKVITASDHCQASSSSSVSNVGPNQSMAAAISSRLVKPDEKRSMSEITNVSRSRVKEVGTSSGNSSGREERMRRLWLSIARRTIGWFGGPEKSMAESENKRSNTSNV